MIRSLFVLLGLLITTVVLADDEFVAGRHYDNIDPPTETNVAAGKIEIVELFWYGCPHCYEFEPLIASWLKTKAPYIEFVRMPAVFAANWEIHARAFYAAEQLGVLDQVHEPLFDALHRERRKVFSEGELAAFYAEHGVRAEDFHKAYNSFDVDKKTRRAAALTRKYGIGGVPAIIINGKYRSSTQQAGSYENLLKVANFLAAKEASR
jgi:protein dithiol oxidoreductase (disulfide-forming)